MLGGKMNEASSGLTRLTNGGAASARRVSSSYPYDCPARSQMRRHSCTSHRPMMFFKKRIVPPTPPSLVKLHFSTCSLTSGDVISAPISDQVPELIVAHEPPREGTAANADPVSCVAGAITG